MKDPGFAVRKAYYEILNGNLTLNGQNVPFFDIVPKEAKPPFVYVNEQTTTDDSSKDCFNAEHIILLDVVTQFRAAGTRAHVDNIGDQIMQLIIKHHDFPNALPDFRIYGVRLENTNTLESEEETNYTIRKLIRIRNWVEQVEEEVTTQGFPYTLPLTLT